MAADKIKEALARAVADSGVPGAVAYVGRGDETIFHGAQGHRALVPERLPARKDTIYDLASVTKVVATTTSALLLYERGLLDLEQPVTDFVPIPTFAPIRIRHLLNHTAGFPPFKTWFREATSVDEYIQRIGTVPLESPPGSRRVYSDLGFMLLGKIVELAGRNALDAFARENIFAPCGMKRTTFNPPPDWRADCAATEQCAWRGRMIQGEVHDENAFAVGGVAGHAGLFSTAADLARFARALRGGNLLKTDTLDQIAAPLQVPAYPWQGLGWKFDPWAEGSEGHLRSRRAIGHTGWTGTCLWIDLDSEYFAILLANTPHPSREVRDNPTLRKTFFGPVAALCHPDSTNAHSGLDRLPWEDFDPVRGKRLALLTNQGGVDQAGRALLDVIGLAPESRVVRVFSPEHGFAGQAEAGESVGAQRAPVEVVSLYGTQKAPAPEQLRDVELFVIDLPDIGARYYTYMATMKLCMEVCATAGVPVLVLDRPNPLGGLILEGPVATHFDSLVCCAPIPIRHGMTLGELALFFKSTFPSCAAVDLRISEVGGWPRALMAPACALPWVAPSPNIPVFDSALLYIGTCLFEGVNLNEGRGTETPFQVFGAPWLDAERVRRDLERADGAGCSLEVITYTPRSIPGKARTPIHQDELCRGLKIHVEDRNAARPFRLAYALLRAIHRHHGAALTWKPFFDTLAGGPGLRAAIERGDTPERYLKSIAAELEQFDRTRPRRYTD